MKNVLFVWKVPHASERSAEKEIKVVTQLTELLGFQINNEFYFDKTLLFGLSYSCNLFENISLLLPVDFGKQV